MTEFLRLDRVEPAARAGWWYAWAVFRRGAEEFAQAFKFPEHPTTEQHEQVARAWADAANVVEVPPEQEGVDRG